MNRRHILLTGLCLATLACSMPLVSRQFSAPTSAEIGTTAANPSVTATPAPSGLIVYTCFQDGFDQICAMNADGSNQHRLTTSEATDFYASLAPGGQAIVFSSHRDGPFNIYRMDIDGQNITPLTTKLGDNYAPEVSPDGSRIVFVSTFKGSEDIWLMNADGSNPSRLTNYKGSEIDPTWSPDGQQIAFTSDHTGTNELYIMDVTGANTRQVTNGSDQREGGRSDWSPDGKTLAFYAGPVGDKNIYLVPIECAKVRPSGCGPDKFTRLTDGGNNKAPSFSPDGEWIVFAAGKSADDKDNNIFVMRVDGTDRKQLTSEAYAEYQPRWGQ